MTSTPKRSAGNDRSWQQAPAATGDTTATTAPESHPAAELFPRMNDKEIASLSADIKLHGLQQPIEIYDGKVLDGRNRLTVCGLFDIEPEFVDVTESIDDPYSHVIAVNLQRRQLSKSQRSMLAARMATRDRGNLTGANQHGGGKTSIDGIPAPTIKQAADLAGVSKASVERCKRIMADGAAVLVDAVDEGDVAVGLAFKLVDAGIPEDEQIRLVGEGRDAIKRYLGLGVKDWNYVKETVEKLFGSIDDHDDDEERDRACRAIQRLIDEHMAPEAPAAPVEPVQAKLSIVDDANVGA